MNTSKGFSFAVLFIVAAAGAGYILYTKESSTLVTPVTKTSLVAQVKGTSLSATTTAQISDTSTGEYTKKNSLSHLELTDDNIIWYTNYERAKNNLPPLKKSAQLESSSHAKGTDMFQYQYFDHNRKDGQTTVGFDSFIDTQKYAFVKIGENLAMGDFSTSEDLLDAWMKSPAHRRNLLDPLYQDIGVSINAGTMQGTKTVIYTQHFGDPSSSCPTINQATKQAIDTLRSKITDLQTSIGQQQARVSSSSADLDPEFDTLINDYNTLVTGYNASIKQMSALVSLYNGQVRSFDSCIEGKNG